MAQEPESSMSIHIFHVVEDGDESLLGGGFHAQLRMTTSHLMDGHASELTPPDAQLFSRYWDIYSKLIDAGVTLFYQMDWRLSLQCMLTFAP